MTRIVMIVDDQAVIRRMVRAQFATEDFEICDAANGAEAIQRAQAVNPSLIVLDLSMPVMNGLEAARALKRLMPRVPLLMFTNHAGVIVEKEARSAGFSAVVCKSDSDSLKQLITHAKALMRIGGADLRRVS